MPIGSEHTVLHERGILAPVPAAGSGPQTLPQPAQPTANVTLGDSPIPACANKPYGVSSANSTQNLAEQLGRYIRRAEQAEEQASRLGIEQIRQPQLLQRQSELLYRLQHLLSLSLSNEVGGLDFDHSDEHGSVPRGPATVRTNAIAAGPSVPSEQGGLADLASDQTPAAATVTAAAGITGPAVAVDIAGPTVAAGIAGQHLQQVWQGQQLGSHPPQGAGSSHSSASSVHGSARSK